MDSAYDHIQEESYPQDKPKQQTGEGSSDAQPSNFNTEVQEAYKAISSSPWAARLGGFWQTAKKQVGQFQSLECIGVSNHVTIGRTVLRDSEQASSFHQQGRNRRRLDTDQPRTQPLRPTQRCVDIYSESHTRRRRLRQGRHDGTPRPA
jgi:hypothetical protein